MSDYKLMIQAKIKYTYNKKEESLRLTICG